MPTMVDLHESDQLAFSEYLVTYVFLFYLRLRLRFLGEVGMKTYSTVKLCMSL